MNKDVDVEFNKNEVGKVFNINQDLSFAKKDLKWEAKTTLDNGLRKTIKWYQNNKRSWEQQIWLRHVPVITSDGKTEYH